jgi:hypothetical protein
VLFLCVPANVHSLHMHVVVYVYRRVILQFTINLYATLRQQDAGTHVHSAHRPAWGQCFGGTASQHSEKACHRFLSTPPLAYPMCLCLFTPFPPPCLHLALCCLHYPSPCLRLLPFLSPPPVYTSSPLCLNRPPSPGLHEISLFVCTASSSSAPHPLIAFPPPPCPYSPPPPLHHPLALTHTISCLMGCVHACMHTCIRAMQYVLKRFAIRA